jgi:AraC-like DNA-binding protein
MRGTLQLSLSQIVAEAELYEGENIHTFATDWHFHEGWQVVIPTKGGRRYQFRDGTVTARPGQLLILPPRLVHKARCVEKGRTSFKIFILPKAEVETGSLSRAVTISAPKAVEVCLSVFRTLADGSDGEQRKAAFAHFRRILSQILSKREGRYPALPPGVVLAAARIMSWTNMSWNGGWTNGGRMDEVPSLDLLSSSVGLSRYHLAHTFSKHVGLSPLAFYSRIRLMQARLLLAQGWSLADTSAQLKFADQSHFGRHFKRIYGMTPGEYQQSVTAQKALLY